MIFILDKDEKVVAIATNNGSPNSCPYYNDFLKEYVDTGVSTYEFYVPSNHPVVNDIPDNGYVVRKDLDGKLRMFQILSIGDKHSTFSESSKKVFAEDCGLELVDDCIRPATYNNYTTDQVVSALLVGQRWAIGNVDYFGIFNFNFDSWESILNGLQTVAKQVGGELQFRVEMQNNQVSGRYVDIVKQRGEKTYKRFTYSKDITSITRTPDKSQLATALIGRGNNDITFSSVTATVSANGYDKPVNQDWVGDPDALQQYGRKGKHIFKQFQYATDDANVLLQKTWEQLQIQKNPSVTYELQVALLERLTGIEHEKVRIGDTVDIVDQTFSPPLLLEARVLELDTCFSDPTQDQCTLGNYVVKKSDINYQMRLVQGTLLQKSSNWDSAYTTVNQVKDQLTISVQITSTDGLIFRNGQLNTTLVATVIQGASDVTTQLPASAFTWHKYDSKGNEDTAWYNAHLGIGRSVAVTYAETGDNASFECDVDASSLTTTTTTVKAQITLANVNDGIVTTQPTNPVKDQLWLDESVTPNPMLKKWDGTQWVNEGEMSATLTDSLNSLNTSINNMTNDTLIDFKERQTVKQNISNIIGSVISDQATTLPTTDTLDASGQGSFYSVRHSAQSVGIVSTDTEFVNLTDQYNSLKTYLEGLVPLPWDAGLPNRNSTITVDPSEFRNNFLNYYIAEDILRTATAQQLQNGVQNISDSIGGYDTRITNVELATTPDSIVSVVTTSDKYTGDLSKFVTTDQFTQTTDSINAKFSMGGGVNLVKNSVGFASTNMWTVTGTVNTAQNDELTALGFKSGFQDSVGVSGSLSQTIYTNVGQDYTLSFYMRKDTDSPSNALLGIYIYDANNNLVKFTGIDTNMGTTVGYQEFNYSWTSKTATHSIVPTWGSATTGVITGIMVNIGDTALRWSMAAGEFYNGTTKSDINGLSVSQTLNGIETGRTVMRPTKFAGYYDVNGDGVIDESDNSPDEVFRMDKDEFKMKKANVSQEITLGGMKMVTTSSGVIAFVKNS